MSVNSISNTVATPAATPGVVVFSNTHSVNLVSSLALDGIQKRVMDVALLDNPDDATRAVLLAHPHYAEILGFGLLHLNFAGILDDANRAVLLAHLQYAKGLGFGLRCLHGAGILDDANRAVLVDNPQHAESLGFGLSSLHGAGILDDDNRAVLLAHLQHAEFLGSGLSSLHHAGILDDANRAILLAHPQYAKGLALALIDLGAAGILNAANRAVLLANPQYAESLGFGLLSLDRAGILDDANRAAILANPQYAEFLGCGLTNMRVGGILSQGTFNMLLLDGGAHIEAIVNVMRYQPGSDLSLNFEKFEQIYRDTMKFQHDRCVEAAFALFRLKNVGLSLNVVRCIVEFLVPKGKSKASPNYIGLEENVLASINRVFSNRLKKISNTTR